MLELPNKNEKIIAFAWEPKGHRFAVVSGDSPRPTVTFYTMRDDKGRLAVKMIGGWLLWSKMVYNIVWIWGPSRSL